MFGSLLRAFLSLLWLLLLAFIVGCFIHGPNRNLIRSKFSKTKGGKPATKHDFRRPRSPRRALLIRGVYPSCSSQKQLKTTCSTITSGRSEGSPHSLTRAMQH